MGKHEKTGVSSGIEQSSERAKRNARRRRAEERAWREKSGPVTVRRVRRVDPRTLRD